jgi:hypothetical protein
MSNLVGNVLNINTGDWVRRDSGVGAGIDSYYEYVAKAYILLGDEKYLGRWQTHYAAIMKYLGQVRNKVQIHLKPLHPATKKAFKTIIGDLEAPRWSLNIQKSKTGELRKKEIIFIAAIKVLFIVARPTLPSAF